MDPPLVFQTMPRVLRVRLPRHAIGLSPAARAVHVASRSTIVELSRVIAGYPVTGRDHDEHAASVRTLSPATNGAGGGTFRDDL